jgi:hypothetical protein
MQNAEIKITDGERSWTLDKNTINEVYINSYEKSIVIYDTEGNVNKLPFNTNIVEQCMAHGLI